MKDNVLPCPVLIEAHITNTLTVIHPPALPGPQLPILSGVVIYVDTIMKGRMYYHV